MQRSSVKRMDRYFDMMDEYLGFMDGKFHLVMDEHFDFLINGQVGLMDRELTLEILSE